MVTLKRVGTIGLGAVFVLAGCASSTEQADTANPTEEPLATEESTDESEQALQQYGEEEALPEEEENLGIVSTEIRHGDQMTEEEENLGIVSTEVRRGGGWGRGGGRWGGGGFHRHWGGGHGGFRGGHWGWRWHGGRRVWGWRYPWHGGWGWYACDPRFDWRCRGYGWY